jgi:hypothetical protein
VHGEESAFPRPASSREPGGFDQIEGAELPAEVAAEMHEECRRLLKMLTSEEQKIVQRKVEGCTHAEIAAELRCAVCTVERKVALIRKRGRGTYYLNLFVIASPGHRPTTPPTRAPTPVTRFQRHFRPTRIIFAATVRERLFRRNFFDFVIPDQSRSRWNIFPSEVRGFARNCGVTE